MMPSSPTTLPPLAARIAGIGLVGPGFDDWASARAILAGETAWTHAPTRIPNPALLPPAERRRVGNVVKLAIGAGLQAVEAAGADAATLATVFASSGGDGANCHAICEVLASDDRAISPTRFHNSVNNAASGYWGIATGAMAASTIVSAYDGSFAAGLLEALTQINCGAEPVLLIVYDHPYPAPLDAARPQGDAFGLALLLLPDDNRTTLPRLALGGFTGTPSDRLADAGLETLRSSIPGARALPLLQQLALGHGGRSTLAYLDGLQLTVDLQP